MLTQQLGDYGHWNNDRFEVEGNVFKHLVNFDLCPVEQVVTDRRGSMDEVRFGSGDSLLILQDPRAWSIPDTKYIKEWLRTLSINHKGKCFVSTIVRCSRCSVKDRFRRGACYQTYSLSMFSLCILASLASLPVSTPLCTLTQPLVWYEAGTEV